MRKERRKRQKAADKAALRQPLLAEEGQAHGQIGWPGAGPAGGAATEEEEEEPQLVVV